MRTIGAVTVGRSDYGIYRPVLRTIREDSGLELRLIVAGAHLSDEFGNSVDEITADGFDVSHRVDMLRSDDSPAGLVESMARGLAGFARVFAADRPDILLVLGDRFEMHAAALAAFPFKIPAAHIHGGELTEGAIDDSLRHSITKFSHLHFVTTGEYAARVRQLGEESWRIIVSGAPALDEVRNIDLWSTEEIVRRFGETFREPPLLVTYHPVTLEYEDVEPQVENLLKALDRFDVPILFTAPNADTSGRIVRRMIESFVSRNERAVLVENLGATGYFSMMAYSRAMLGNSSSGIIEAASFGLPVVNVGNRQKGRVRAVNVIDVGYGVEAIADGVRQALDEEFRSNLTGLENPYGDGTAAGVIVDTLRKISIDRLIPKRFVDQPRTSALVGSQTAVHVELDGSRT